MRNKAESNPSERIWITRREAAEYLGVSLKTLRTTLRGEFLTTRIKSCVWYNKADIDAKLQRCSV